MGIRTLGERKLILLKVNCNPILHVLIYLNYDDDDFFAFITDQGKGGKKQRDNGTKIVGRSK